MQHTPKTKKPARVGKPQPAPEKKWYDIMREQTPSPPNKKSMRGLLTPEDYLKNAGKIVNDPYIPPIAPQRLLPTVAEREVPRLLRRFNGGKVIPMSKNKKKIYDADNRVLIADDTYPWCCIGRLDRSDGHSGTATLVGKRFVLTAAHVVDFAWQPGEPLSMQITFTPALSGGQSLLGPSWHTEVDAIRGFKNHHVVGYDLAICRLKEPFGNSLGYMGTCTYDDDWEDEALWSHAGYPYDLSSGGNKMSYEGSIAITDDDSDDYDTLELETEADFASGQSGGPLWHHFKKGKLGGHRIAGVLSGHSSENAEDNTIFAGGAALVALVNWGRDHWD